MPFGIAAVIATTLSFTIRQLDQRVGKDLGIGALAQRLGLARLRIVRPQAVKFLLLLQRRLEALALLREHVQQNGTFLRLQKLERLNQRGDVVAIDRPVILQAKLLEDHAGPQHALGSLFRLARHAQGPLAAHALNEFPGTLVQVIVAWDW